MRKMIEICDRYANEYSVKFNASKSKCLYYPTNYSLHQTEKHQLPLFTIAGKPIEDVENWQHLGHNLSTVILDD
jgi:hypothetical protein